MHAPNEKFHLPNFYKGIETSIWFLSEIAGLSEDHSSSRKPFMRRGETTQLMRATSP